jgi:UDP-N-acetylmuramoylalanine--D-glutamate ligase
MGLGEKHLRQNFEEFKSFIKEKKVGVVGIGVSNTPLIKMLVGLGARVTACDKRTDLGEISLELNDMGVELCLGENYLEGILDCDVIFRTPSLMPTNEYLQNAAKRGAYITSEMGEFLKYCPAKVFGVTGSDGKTTTTTLISEMLKEQGYNVFLGGNIGRPLFNEIEKIGEDDYVVVELSSFQLMDIKYSPDVAVITNLSPNHLDIHKDMDEYINAKKNIFLNQKGNGTVVLNMDNNITCTMKDEIKSEVRMFSIRSNDTFSYLDNNSLTVNGKVICNLEEVKLPGMHNIENLLTAFATLYDYVSVDSMRKVATTFTGVAHRIEFVREIDGVRFYNDSIASSPTRTVAGLRSFNQKVILIAGGYDKKIPFDELAEGGIDRIKTLVVMGMTKEKIKEAFNKEFGLRNTVIPIVEADSLEDAVNKSFKSANEGDIIILSPACASFDMFKNFEVRGNKFKEIVMGI